MNVSNRSCIRRLGRKTMGAARGRNLIAVAAIVLTTVLFTTLFTIALSINASLQASNFRMVGGYEHGGFKYLEREQMETLREDPMIREYGLRRIVGMPMDPPFHKAHVEVSYCDKNEAKFMFLEPSSGALPAEGTAEAATDSRVLSLLGVEPALGVELALTFLVDGAETTETFTLSGWWEYDPAITASHVLIPESRAETIFHQLDTRGEDGMTGKWNLDVMLSGASRIEQDLDAILANHGYQSAQQGAEDYIATGVNWGYTGAQVANSIDPAMVAGIILLLLLIALTGYLIIYNVFQISVAGDTRLYGLLKTIGTTRRQVKRIIRQQALLLSAAGIPLGLLAGYLVGVRLAPMILARLDGIPASAVSASPLIFLLSALFALVTVLVSCRRPGRMAARVSPVEAVRYAENIGGKQAARRTRGGASLPKMAWANLGRSRRKTVVTVISLSLAVVLLNLTVTFTRGFDMDKYLHNMVADFIVADARQFQVMSYWDTSMALPEEVIADVLNRDGVTDGGRVYGQISTVQEHAPEDYFRQGWEVYNAPELVDEMVADRRTEDGRVAAAIQLFGMESFALGKLRVLEGDLNLLSDSGGQYIAAVYTQSDYGEPYMDSHWAKLGDTVTLRYVDELAYYDTETGEILEDVAGHMGRWSSRPVSYRDVDYEVAALVVVPPALSYRYYGNDEFVLGAETFRAHTGTDAVMYYALDTTEGGSATMEAYLEELTGSPLSQYDYESKEVYVREFDSMRGLFTILGGILASIIGMVGILNFLNAVMTSILTRRREFAVLQSVGMTGKQLKIMLIWEGMYYMLGAVTLSLLICIATAPLQSAVLTGMFWFFSYHVTFAPILAVVPIFAALGIALPVLSYRFAAKRSLVERLREVE